MSTTTEAPTRQAESAPAQGPPHDGGVPESEIEDGTDASGFRAAATATHLQAVFEPVSRLVDECKLHLDPDGIEITAVDQATVAMVSVDATASGFHSFEAGDSTLGVPLDRLLDVLSMAEDGSSLVQFQLDQQTRTLDVVVDGIEYSMALIDPDTIRSEPEMPSFKHPVEATVHYEAFSQGFKAADMVDENCEFEASADADSLRILAEGTDRVDYELSPRNDCELEAFEMADPREHGPDSAYDILAADDRFEGLAADVIGSVYSLDYLKDMRIAFPSDGVIEFSLGSDLPVQFAFELAEGDVNVRYLVAPRIRT